MGLSAALRRLDGALEVALAEVGVPAYLLDWEGRIRWLNHVAVDQLWEEIDAREDA